MLLQATQRTYEPKRSLTTVVLAPGATSLQVIHTLYKRVGVTPGLKALLCAANATARMQRVAFASGLLQLSAACHQTRC